MQRKLFIPLLVIVLFAAGAVATYILLPRQYLMGERLTQATVFWNDKEAFVFLNIMTVGRSHNAIQERIASSRYGWLMGVLGIDFSEQKMIAYHLLASGTVESPPVPAGTATFGNWELVDDKLQLTTFVNGYKNLPGFRWDGVKFLPVPPLARPDTSASTGSVDLSEDDATADDDEPDSPFFDKKRRAAFKAAGWHWKFLNGYEGAQREATLPIILGASQYNLTVQTNNWQKENRTDLGFLGSGARQLQIAGDALPAATVLWQQNGWQQVPRADYERHIQHSGRRAQMPVSIWAWLALVLLFAGWKIWAWVRVIIGFATVKKRVLTNLSTSFSFPPALPSQFPLLDTAALERYTRDLESMGFRRLIDTSPTSDAPNHPATFSRVLVHTGHHCFAEVSQFFPRGKAPMAMRCTFISHLQDGWSVAFTDRKPLPAGAIVRRPKALGVNMPEASPAELLQSLLTLRQQVCVDLGLAPLTQDSLESYIARVQQGLTDIRAAVSQKNFLTAVPQYYYRKLALTKTKPEYVWLGDYPSQAEQRKQACGMVPVS